MRILILSDSFSAPAYKPRLRALCTYLCQQGHMVEVICEKADALNFEHDYPIHEIPFYNGHFLDWALKNFASLWFNWKDSSFYDKVEKIIGGGQYDLVFCSSFYTFPLQTTNRIARKLQIPSVIDLRDMIEQAPTNQTLYLRHHSAILNPFAHIYRHINIHRRNKELQRANIITTVSPWHVDLVKSISSRPCFLIYNGYDDTIFHPKDVITKQFKIIYTGKVFPQPQQDPTLLFEALKRLRLSPKQICVEWYTDEKSERLIKQMAHEAGVEQWLHYNGVVSQDKIPELLHKASICLVLTSKANDNNGHGKMTTKFFEALGVEKPVLCVESDEECLAHIIQDTNAGISALNVDQVCSFILDKYADWQANGFTRQNVDMQKKKLFSRREQAKQWEKIFKDITG